MAKTPAGTYVVARNNFMVGESLRVRKGDIFAADDPAVKGREAMFEPIENRVRTTRAGDRAS